MAGMTPYSAGLNRSRQNEEIVLARADRRPGQVRTGLRYVRPDSIDYS
jgi:hypothetical protein